MAFEKVAIVHSIKMIAGKNQQRVDAPVSDVRQHLSHGVSSSLKPLRALGRLLGCDDLDEAVRELREAIGLRDVTIERCGVVLRQDERAQDVGVDAVRERDVDETILTAERNGWFGTLLRKRKKSIAGAAAENNREEFWICRHASLSLVICHLTFAIYHLRSARRMRSLQMTNDKCQMIYDQ